nr:stage II sporulation protein M [Paenibacillus roseus]
MVKDQLALYIFVGVLFIVGVVFGVVMAGALTLEQQQDLTGDVEHFVKLLNAGLGPDKTASFWDRAWFHTKWVLLIWLLGLTVIGTPLLLVLDFLKGALVGFSMGLLIGQHAWSGVLFWLIAVAPQNVLVVPALLIASVAGLSFAAHFVKVRLLQKNGSLARPLIAHTLTAVCMLAVLWAAAWFEAYVSPLIMGWASRFL